MSTARERLKAAAARAQPDPSDAAGAAATGVMPPPPPRWPPPPPPELNTDTFIVEPPTVQTETSSSAVAEAEAAVRRLEEALTRSGSAAAIEAACKELLEPGAVFSWPLGRCLGGAAIARHFSLFQLLFVDRSTIDYLAVSISTSAFPGAALPQATPPFASSSTTQKPAAWHQGPTRVVLARLTHRLTPRLLDALAGPPAPSPLLPEAIGRPAPAARAGAGAAAGFQGPFTSPRSHAPGEAASSSSPSPYPSSSPLSPLPASLRPLAAWLRDRLTFKVIDNATYVFARRKAAASSAYETRPAPPPKIAQIRAEIALVSLLYALPFGEALLHGAFEPLLGAATQPLAALWRGVVRPWVAPWARARLSPAAWAPFEAL